MHIVLGAQTEKIQQFNGKVIKCFSFKMNMDFPDYSPLFVAVLLFKWVVFIWDEYLTFRQRRIVKTKTTVPEPLAGVLDDDTMNKTRMYSLDKMTFGFWHSLYSEIETSVILVLFALPWLWDLCGDCLDQLPWSWAKGSEILQSLLFVFVFSVYGVVTGKCEDVHV